MTPAPLTPEYPTQIHPDSLTNGVFCYVASHPDLPGCVGFGETIAEAKRQLALVREAYLTDVRARGETPPEPTSASASAIEWEIGLRQAPQSQVWEVSYSNDEAGMVPATA